MKKNENPMHQLKILFVFMACFISVEVLSQERGVESENRLFHIERSKNRNLVCYDINLANGSLDMKHPLDIYWVNREERAGEVKGLSAFERKLAYGYKVVSSGDNMCNITLSAYPGRELTVRKEGDNYICTMIIDGQPAIMKKLYVKAKESNSLSVEYVELTGVSIETGKEVSEKVKNK